MENQFNVLCVGCGNKPEGNVNIDAFPLDRTQCTFDYDIKNIINFCVGSGEYLPLKDKLFKIVIARHCLEHMENPLGVLKEFKRVCFGKVIIIIPSEWSHTPTKTHLFSWGILELNNLMKEVFYKVDVRYTTRLGFFVHEYQKKKPHNILINTWLKIFGLNTEIIGVGYAV